MNSYKEIINLLSECVRACQICTSACLEEENVKKLAACIKLNMDCADICSLGIKLLSRNSDLALSVISLCADICVQCAEECEKHASAHCKKCADACRACEEICKTHLNNVRQAAMNS